jgi:hypothetical protein
MWRTMKVIPTLPNLVARLTPFRMPFLAQLEILIRIYTRLSLKTLSSMNSMRLKMGRKTLASLLFKRLNPLVRLGKINFS